MGGGSCWASHPHRRSGKTWCPPCRPPPVTALANAALVNIPVSPAARSARRTLSVRGNRIAHPLTMPFSTAAGSRQRLLGYDRRPLCVHPSNTARSIFGLPRSCPCTHRMLRLDARALPLISHVVSETLHACLWRAAVTMLIVVAGARVGKAFTAPKLPSAAQMKKVGSALSKK